MDEQYQWPCQRGVPEEGTCGEQSPLVEASCPAHTGSPSLHNVRQYTDVSQSPTGCKTFRSRGHPRSATGRSVQDLQRHGCRDGEEWVQCIDKNWTALHTA